MDGQVGVDMVNHSSGEESTLVEAASTEFLQHWCRLVSTTNWEKGRIISEWRKRLIDSGTPPQSCSDEAWSRMVGNVSGQHVGRLRRVYERFGTVYTQYQGLYWSHFQAALDWDDAEMWLEGAVQSKWSITEMRTNRWQTLGAPVGQQPREDEIISAELDEDADPEADPFGPVESSLEEIHAPGDDDDAPEESCDSDEDVPFEETAEIDHADPPAIQPVRPFENLARLPDDLAEAFEAFKLAILSHKLTGWEEVSCGEVVAALDALKTLALAPSET